VTDLITHDNLCLLAEKFLVKNAFGVTWFRYEKTVLEIEV
jgi:hypothetical protein